MRKKLTVNEQIEHMKSKGIQFNIISEKDAENYLNENTYYFKLKAYAKMFEKYKTGPNVGRYVNLEFAYLKELAILDMHLRHFILKTSVDVEHTIKVKFLTDFNKSTSDGYEIIDKFFMYYPDVKNKILEKRKTSYCADLIDKLEYEGYAIWNIIELLSFGDFINLYELFYREYPEAKDGILYTYPMRSIKSLRNAAAHNNCILNQLTRSRSNNTHVNKKVVSFVSQNNLIGKAQRINCMEMQAVHDFVTLLYVIHKAVNSEGIKRKMIEELHWLIDGRFLKHKEYFQKNNSLMTVYDFMRKMIDNYFPL